MKYIKRVSAVKPITGSIVDTTNIDDKSKNTYSAGVIDDKISKAGGVEVGTIVDWEDGVEIPEGWEEIEVFNVYKATIDDTYLTRGSLEVAQYGKLVVLTFRDIEFKISMTGSNDATLFTGIPAPSSKYDSEIPLHFMLTSFNLASGARIAIRGNRVTTYFLNTNEPLTTLYTGQFIYFTD